MEKLPKLKVGVIGVGALGRHHARLYAQSPNAEVVGIYDVQRDTATAVGEEFGLQVFHDWRELAESCEALSVAVPANYHASSTLPLLEMGKHVLVEKPIAASFAFNSSSSSSISSQSAASESYSSRSLVLSQLNKTTGSFGIMTCPRLPF